jgi:hypothetical protein
MRFLFQKEGTTSKRLQASIALLCPGLEVWREGTREMKRNRQQVFGSLQEAVAGGGEMCH